MQTRTQSAIEACLNVCEKCGAQFRVKPYRRETARFCSEPCSGKGVAMTERFWSKVDRRAGDECWLWLMSCGTTGYGQFNHGSGTAKAHRLAFELTYGPIPSGIGVLHRCDTPRCCNPRHLFLGTQKDNVADMDAKGRRVKAPARRGEASPNAKLTTEAVKEIIASSESGRALARRFGVSDTAIAYVRSGRNWGHVA